MEIPWLQLVEVAAIFFFSSAIQGAVGFAAGMFGVPLFLMCGIELHQAVALALMSSMVSNFSGAWQLRQEFDWKLATWPIALRTLAQPLGALALFTVVRDYKDWGPPLVGGTLLVMLVLQWWFRIEPQETIPSIWTWIAFPLSGFLFSFCSMGGPPLVMWVMAHRWPAIRMRAFLFFVFASGLIPQTILLFVFYGWKIAPAMLVGCLGIPVLLAGTHLGLSAGARLPDQQLRRFSFGLLVLLGIGAIVTPWLH